MTWNTTLKRSTPLRARGAISRRSQPIKSKGMKGSSVSTAQKEFHGQLASRIGCVACRMDGIFNDYVSIHHIDGRTKPDAHWKVLPLCRSHHQDDGLAIAVHPHKAMFETRYGKQIELLVWCIEQLQLQGASVNDQALAVVGMEDFNRNEDKSQVVVSYAEIVAAETFLELGPAARSDDSAIENAEPT
jgi:hypothetical protein